MGATSLDVMITVNFPDGREVEFQAAGSAKFAKLGELVEFALAANGVKEGDWSSLVLTVVSPTAPKQAAKPALRLVQP